MDISTLDTLGFVTFAYPRPLRLRVQEAMRAFERFCDLPIGQRQKLSKFDRGEDFGYMLRRDKKTNADSKELFEFLGRDQSELRTMAQNVHSTRATELIDAADVLAEAIAPSILAFARGVEARYGATGFEREVAQCQHLWNFRFVHYFGGAMLANPHADRKGFTLHLCESDEGGEYLGFDRVWRPWPVSSEKTIIFPSIGLQHRTQCQTKALYHRVVSNERTRATGRYSMVAFIDFPQEREWDTYTYPHVQDFDVGFNYDMSYAELDRHFVARKEAA